MKEFSNVIHDKELPSSLSEEIGREYSNSISKEQKKLLGQFFTSKRIADFMVGLLDFDSQKKKVKILDPGCGALSLTCALVQGVLNRNKNVKVIEIDLFEIDSSLESIIINLSKVLKDWSHERGVEVVVNYSNSDFLFSNKNYLKNDSYIPLYDFVISNPPYFKIKKGDERLTFFNSVLQGQQNIYSLFMLGASKLLKRGGQLVFIVPRSFTSGVYFQSFQKLFLEKVDLQIFHLFNSRVDGFKKDKVLQENVILKAIRKKKTKPQIIKISTSQGVSDLREAKEKEFSIDYLFRKMGKLNVIHLPVNDFEEKAMDLFSTWSHNLSSFGLKVSTGPVVPFRARKYLKFNNVKGMNCVPLIWMHNCLKMKLIWPYEKNEKESWITNNIESNTKTLDNRNYILLRRFSSKDDKSKLVATPYLKKWFDFDGVGVENHLNYLYKQKGILELEELFGLSVLYNSKIFDAYFRSLSGNTQVSATELNALPLPSLDLIKQIGTEYIALEKEGIEEIDNIVNRVFKLT